MPTDLDTRLVEEHADAVSSRCITRLTEGTRVNTTAIVLQCHDHLPVEVQVNSVRYRTRVYVLYPMRCSVCQRYGHRTARRPARRVCCGGQDDFSSCPVKDDATKHRCVNCGGRHSAAFRQCNVNLRVKEVLRVSATTRMSYSDAMKKVKAISAAVSCCHLQQRSTTQLHRVTFTIGNQKHIIRRSQRRRKVMPARDWSTTRQTPDSSETQLWT